MTKLMAVQLVFCTTMKLGLEHGRTGLSLRRRYLSYIVPGFLRRGLTATTLRIIPPNRQGLEASVVTDVKILRKCATPPALPSRIAGCLTV